MAPEPPAAVRRAGVLLMERLRRTDALTLLPELNESQWWDAGRLVDQQARRLQELLRWCRDEVPYYRRLFARLGFAPESVRSTEDLKSLPILEKADIRNAGRDLCSSAFARLQPRAKSTSGSTGVPLNYYLDRRSHSYLWAQIWRAWGQAGYRPGDRYATLSGGSLVPQKVDFKQRVYLALSGALHLPSYHLTSSELDRYAEILAQRQVAFLYGYPSSVGLFARHCQEQRRPALALRAVFTTSEQLLPQTRATIATTFGCPVIDTYGCNDGGLYSFECAEARGFHYGMESVIVEVVDETGTPLPAGCVGRIVTTHLVNRAEPFLRYATGDLGALDPTSCPCGRGLVRIVDLQGRERDFVVTPKGRYVHGAFFNHFEPFYRSAWIERFQIYQPDRTRLIVRLHVRREPTESERERVLSELQRGLGPMDIQLAIGAEMALSSTGKFRVIVSDVAGQPSPRDCGSGGV